jgi:hypothetical protein
MLVRMLERILGTRNGVAWPPRGGVIDLPDSEALALFAHGYAQPVPPAKTPAFAHQSNAEAAVIQEVRESATVPARKVGKARGAR